MEKRWQATFRISLSGFLLFAFLFLPYSFAPHRSQFFPSPAYLESVKYYALVSAAVGATLGIMLVVHLPGSRSRNTGLQRLINIVLAPIALAIFGHTFVTTTIPLDVALLWGEETSMIFAVESLEHTESKSCKTSIRLAGLPTLINTLCNLPPSLRQQLTTGSEIVVTGRGTHMGVFAENTRLAQQPATP